jgi:hypothetical protein
LVETSSASGVIFLPAPLLRAPLLFHKFHTGTKDEHFNLISVLYHSLQCSACCEEYIEDAQQAGDRDLSQFFQQIKEQNQATALR